jgi:AAA domain/Homeodomain-like domain
MNAPVISPAVSAGTAAERCQHSVAEILRVHNIVSPAAGSGYTTCPQCSALRKPANQKKQVLHVTVDRDGVQWFCNHCQWFGGELFEPRAGQMNLVASYDYRSENGELLFQTLRFFPKDFRQRRPNGKGEWIWNLQGTRRVLYRLPELLAAKNADPKRPVFVVEGEKDADALQRGGATATCNPMGAGKWRDEYAEFLRGFEVVAVIADKDEPGRAHAQQVAASVAAVVKQVKVIEFPGERVKDASDFIAAGGALQEIYDIAAATPDFADADNCASEGRLKPLTLSELFDLEIKAREMMLDPILPEKGLVMVYAYRGIGKTHVALGIAYAVASGGTFLRWKAPKPRRVLLIDGEMPAAALRDRLAGIVASAQQEAALDAMRVIAGDLIEEGGIGNLADPAVQAELDKYLDGVDLLILDNLSSLTAVIRDNDQESWTTIQQWLLRLRRRGISVLLVHHAGKAGEQRGTSRREDVLDTSISLRRPSDYVASEGARFEVHIEKGRGLTGDAAKPFEAKLTADPHGKPIWTIHEIADVQKARVEALVADGLSVREIAEETDIPKSTVHRIKKAMERSTNA